MEQKGVRGLAYDLDASGFTQQAAGKRMAGIAGQYQAIKAVERTDGSGNRKFLQHYGPQNSACTLIVRYFVHDSQRGPEFLGEVTPRGVLKKLIPKTAQQPDDNLHNTHSGSLPCGPSTDPAKPGRRVIKCRTPL